MKNTILFIPILASFFITLFLTPFWIKRAKRAGITGKDVHKIENIEIAESGGIPVLTGFILGLTVFIAIQTFVFNSKSNFTEIFALLSVIIMLALLGFTDDIFGWKIGLNKKTRLILVLFSSIPLMAINAGRSDISIPLFGTIDLGIVYPIIFIPIGIIGATTTFNFLAGYNGLEAGQGILLLSALGIVAFLTGNSWLAIIALCMIASLIAFIFYNFYPAKVFPGDSLTYAVGGLIAVMAILGNFERIAVFFFIPYILETGLKLRGKLLKQSFSKPKIDGTLDLMYNKIYGLEHVAVWLMKRSKIKPTEKKVVFSIWTFQILIIILGFILFRKIIF